MKLIKFLNNYSLFILLLIVELIWVNLDIIIEVKVIMGIILVPLVFTGIAALISWIPGNYNDFDRFNPQLLIRKTNYFKFKGRIYLTYYDKSDQTIMIYRPLFFYFRYIYVSHISDTDDKELYQTQIRQKLEFHFQKELQKRNVN